MAELSLSGVVLAGGRSQRLGQDKASLRLWGPQGPSLLEATLARLAPVCDEVLVISDGPRGWPVGPARLVFDRYPGGGVLGGIYTGLLEATYPFVLAVACDMPFLNSALLRAMAGLPRDYDVLIPRRRSPGPATGNAGRMAPDSSDNPPLFGSDRPSPVPGSVGDPARRVEPLHAIYGRPCLEPMRQVLERGERRIVRFFPQVRVRYLEEEEWARFDPAGRSFRNINTPQDLQEVLGMIGQS